MSIENSSVDPDSTLSLLARVRLGDENALDVLLSRYWGRMARWARGRLPISARDLCDTEDIVQDAITRALRHLGTFEPQHEAALQAYLRTAVLNRIKEEIRNVGRRPASVELDPDLPSQRPSPLEQTIGRELLDRYEASLQALTPDERDAVVGRLEFGYSYAELALSLNRTSAEGVRKLVERAFVKMAEHMGND